MLLMAWVVLPTAANDYLKIYFKDGHTERHYMKLVENISATKYDLEGNLHSDYQMQQIVMKDTTYSYYLADIDSMAFRKVYEEQIKKDIETVTSGAESALQSCQTVEEMGQHLEELRSLEGVESVSMIPSGVVIQIRDWRNVFYIIPPEYIEEDNEQQYSSENLARLKLFQNRTPMTSSSDSGRPIKVALANKLHGDAARMGQQSAMTTLDLELKLLGFESQYINNVDLKFFLEDIYEYDHVILLTHGIYYMDTGVHHLATDTKIHKSESGNWVLDSETEALLDQSDIDELGIYTAEFGGIDFAYYATVSENFINKRTSKKEHQKPSIFFNGACLSLYGNDILERSVEPYEVRGNDNMAKALCKDNSFDIYIGYTDENHRGIHGGVNLFRNMLNGQSEEVAFSNIKPKYLCDDYLFNQAYLTEVCYDSNPQISPRKSFLVKTKTKEMSALDIVAYDVDGKIRLKGNTTMLYPKESTVKCGFKYTFDGVDYHEILCEKEYNGGDLREDNVSFSTTIDSPSGQNLTYRAFTYDGKNYNWGEERSFTLSETPVDGDRTLAASFNAGGAQYGLYIKQDKYDVVYNADGTPYYRTAITLDVTKNGSMTSYTVDNGPYFEDFHNNQGPCVAINQQTNQIFIFASSSLGWSYALEGYCYVSQLNNISFNKETVFTEANWGWYPYFTYENGTLCLNHFSFAGYYAMFSTRSSNGIWYTDYGYSIYPDEFDAQSKQAGNVYVIQ